MLEQQLDPYVFFRTVYLDRRQNLVYDGKPPKDDEDFGDEEEEPAQDEPDAAAGAEASEATAP